jgi:hypothetical protein
MTEAAARSEIAEPKLNALDIILPPPFGLLSQAIQFRHLRQKLVDCVSDDLLSRSAVDRAGESQLKMTVRVQTKCKRRFSLAAGGSARRWGRTRSRLSNPSSHRSGDRKGFGLSF